MKIVVFDAKPYDIEFFDKWNEKFGADITYFEEKLSLKNVMLTKYQDVVCTFVNDDLNEKVLNILSKNGVRVVAARCAGYNNIDLKAARENRITVLRVPAYSPFAVAEHALALLMTVNRKTHKAYNRTREGNFSLAGLTGIDLHVKTAGIIGTGKIARIIINSARGGLIETEALLDAVKSKQVGGVGLDVYENESSYFFDDKSSQVLEDDVLARLLSFNNVVLTSHQAFLTNEALDNIAEATFNNILSYVKEETLQNEVWYDEENDKIVEGVRVQK